MLRVAVIGLGYWGPNLVRNLAASRRTQVAGLCDRDTVRVQALHRQFPSAKASADPDALLADPEVDAVAIATPVHTHFELARKALQAGKHVLLEKPMAASVSEGQALVGLASACKRVLLVDHVFLYSPAVRKIKDLVTSGHLGDLMFLDSVRINLGLFQHDVNVLWDLAPHDLSIIEFLVGRPARSVVAVGSQHAKHGQEDVAYLHVDYGEGLLASVHVNWLSPVKVRHFMVAGTRRSVLYNDLDPSEKVKVYDRGIDVSPGPEGRREVLIAYRSGDVVAPRLDATEPLRALVEHFADCVEHGAVPVSPGEQGLRVVRILEAAGESLRRGGAVVAL